MKKSIYILLSIAIILTATSCSYLSKVAVLEPVSTKKQSKCEKCYKYHSFINLETKTYLYSSDTISLKICPSPKPGLKFLLGPPFVPFIPNPFMILNLIFPEKDSFYVDMRIYSKRDSLSIDLNKFEFTTGKNKLLKISKISFVTENDVINSPNSWMKYDSLITKPLYIFSTPVYVRFFFEIKNTKVKNLTIKNNIKEINLPIIIFKKRIKFGYNPLYAET